MALRVMRVASQATEEVAGDAAAHFVRPVPMPNAQGKGTTEATAGAVHRWRRGGRGD